MPATRLLAGSLLPLLLAAAAAAESPHPLRFIPDSANLVVRVERPRTLVETVAGLDAVQAMYRLPFVREQLESPAYQRFLQLVAYYERDLGLPWPEILDKVAGRGLTLASKAGGDGAPVLIVAEGTDEAFTRKFLARAIDVFEQELVRQESKEKVQKRDYRGATGYKIGDALFAQVGPAIVFANKNDALKAAIDTFVDGKKSLADATGPAAARKALPADVLAWLWLDLDVARKAPNAKETFALPTNDINVLLLAGATINAVKRAPFLAAGLYREKDTFTLSLRLPGGGRDGLPPALAMHVPPAGAHGSLDLLEPPGVVLSHSFHLDLKALWNHKAALMNDMLAKSFADGEKQANRFLPGTSLGKLFEQSGPYFRFVVAAAGPSGYRTKPATYYPNFALVNGGARDPQFGKSMEGVIRGVALLAGGQFKLKLVTEEHAGVKLIGYRFPEGGQVPDDPENVRFNFSPCFAVVGDQLMGASTIEFGRVMIDTLQRERERSNRTWSAAPLRTRVYGEGGVALLTAFEDFVLGQIILDQAVPPAEAKKQAAQLAAWVKTLGHVELRNEITAKDYRYNLEWKMK